MAGNNQTANGVTMLLPSANNFSAFNLVAAPVVVEAPVQFQAFEVGKSYSTSSACDSECVFTWTVVGRKGQMLTLEDSRGRTSRRKVAANEDGEWCYPSGKFSMCPVIRADRADD